MVFGKKAKEEKAKKAAEEAELKNLKAERMEIDVDSGKEVNDNSQIEQKRSERPLSDEEKALLGLIREYSKYQGVFVFEEFAKLPQAAVEAEKATLLFAVFAELRQMRGEIAELKEVIKEMGA